MDSLTTQKLKEKERATFIKIALITLPITSLLTAATFYILFTNFGHWATKALFILVSTGLLVYIVFSGDVHFGHKTAGMIVTALVTWLFWSLILYFFINRRRKKAATID